MKLLFFNFYGYFSCVPFFCMLWICFRKDFRKYITSVYPSVSVLGLTTLCISDLLLKINVYFNRSKPFYAPFHIYYNNNIYTHFAESLAIRGKCFSFKHTSFYRKYKSISSRQYIYLVGFTIQLLCAFYCLFPLSKKRWSGRGQHRNCACECWCDGAGAADGGDGDGITLNLKIFLYKRYKHCYRWRGAWNINKNIIFW